MRNRTFLLAALAIGFVTTARADLIRPIPSAFTLLGTPESPSAGIPIPDPVLKVSLNPQPLPPFPAANLNLSDPTTPVYSYVFEIDDFSFDIEQVLNIGQQSSGAGVGKVTFNPFQITKKTDAVSVTLQLLSVSNTPNPVLETINIDISGINPDSFLLANPESLRCGAFPCLFEQFSFTAAAPVSLTATAPGPSVSFSVMSGSSDIAFSIVPEPSTWVMMGLGFAALGCAGYRARRAATSIA
jgi:hypothetical protein